MKTCFVRVSESSQESRTVIVCVCVCVGGGRDEIQMKLMFCYGLFLSSTSSPSSSSSLLFWVYQFCGIKSKQNKWAPKQSNLCCSLLFLIVLYFSKCHCYCCLCFLFDSSLFHWRFLSRTMAGFISPTEIFESEGEHWQTFNTREHFFNNKQFWGDGIECCLPIESICQCRIIGKFPFISK